ncbi:MAG TPA: hypothetical protein VMV97_13800 [Sulfuriferula sp.]|nr:hypothetical protein [Sulfuriferula sp.]
MRHAVADARHGRLENGEGCPYLGEGVFGMLKKRRSRRVLSLFLVVLGGVLMYLAPEILPGLVLLGLGVVVELVGIALERRA